MKNQLNDKYICIYGSHKTGDLRNQVIKNLIQRNNYSIITCHSQIIFPFRYFHLLFLFLKQIHKIYLVFVMGSGHRLVPLLKLFCLLFNKKIIFDPYISRYNTRIEDRKLYSKNHLQALICKWQDWSSCVFSDYLIFDTQEHQQYFFSRYNLKKPYSIIPISVDENIFLPIKQYKIKNPLQVLFYGTYIPLHGIEHILKTIAEIKSKSTMQFTLIGSGQTFKQMQALAKKLTLSPSIFHKEIAIKNLVNKINHSDICLGIFDDGIKASQVVPNKVVQYAALGKCIITRESDSVKTYFHHNKNIIFVPPANSEAMTQTLLELEKNISKINDIGKNAGQVFQNNFSEKVLLNKMSSVLKYFKI